jgi:hypothetical protein
MVVLALGACGGEEGVAPSTNASDTGYEDPGLGPVGGEDWPDAIPGDIPVLNGEITLVNGRRRQCSHVLHRSVGH